MDTNKKLKAEKLQSKLDKLLHTKEKRQQAFDKAKQELTTISKEVDSIKFKLFEILQSGSDDATFSSWAKRKIGESGNFSKSENANSVKYENGISTKTENGNSAKSEKHEKPLSQNHQPHIVQSHQAPTGQKNQQTSQQNKNQ